MERVGHGHRVNRAVPQGDRLGAAVERAVGANVSGERLAQRGLRLDGHDVELGGEQRAAELPGTGPQIQHRGARADAQLGHQGTHDRRRVVRAPPLIGAGDRRDTAEIGEGVQHHAAQRNAGA